MPRVLLSTAAVALAIVLSACGVSATPTPTVRPATATPAPTASATLVSSTPSTVTPAPTPQPDGSLEALVPRLLQTAEVPLNLTLVAIDDSDTQSPSIIFLDPGAAQEPGPFAGIITAIVSSVAQESDNLAAQRLFVSQGSLSAGAVVDDILAAQAGADDVRAEELAARMRDVDQQLVYRVTYLLDGLGYHEYRFRVRVDNRVANVIITSRSLASGGEPQTLRAESLDVAERQVARMVAVPQS